MDATRLLDSIHAAWERFVTALIDRLPMLGMALLILVLTVLVSKVAALLVRYLVRLIVRMTPAGRAQKALDDLVQQQRAADLLSRLVFWIGISIGVTEIAATLELTAVGTFVGKIASYLPRLFIAAVIAAAGVIAGRLAGSGIEQAARSAGLSYGAGLGRLLRIAVVLAAIVVAIDQLGLETSFLTSGLLLVVAAMLGAAALAFGFGAKTTVANILASHYIHKLYEIGQRVRIGQAEGRIIRITATAVIVDTGDERLVVPAEQVVTTQTAVLPKEV